MRFYDTHSHPQFAAYNADRVEVLARMSTMGVIANVVGSARDNSQAAIALAQQYPEQLRAIIGMHPGHVGSAGDDHDTHESGVPIVEDFAIDDYRTLANNPFVVGIGETGLDYYRLPEDKQKREEIINKQQEIFAAQLKLADEFELPVAIHTRASLGNDDAYRDTMRILHKHAPRQKGVMHCFAGNVQMMQEFVNMGFYISISGIVTFKHADDIAEVAKQIPTDKLLIETDAPYLTPAPNRGKRNEPSYVIQIAECLAGLRGVRVEEIAERTTANALTLFYWHRATIVT